MPFFIPMGKRLNFGDGIQFTMMNKRNDSTPAQTDLYRETRTSGIYSRLYRGLVEIRPVAGRLANGQRRSKHGIREVWLNGANNLECCVTPRRGESR
jgi:hypothetical protein